MDKSGDKEVVRYYAASKVLQPEPVSNDELAKRLAFVTYECSVDVSHVCI